MRQMHSDDHGRMIQVLRTVTMRANVADSFLMLAPMYRSIGGAQARGRIMFALSIHQPFAKLIPRIDSGRALRGIKTVAHLA